MARDYRSRYWKANIRVFSRIIPAVEPNRPVNAVDWQQNHYQIADCVPELSNIAGELVVRLAPVDCRRRLAPFAVVALR